MKFIDNFDSFLIIDRLLHKDEYIKKILTENGYTIIRSLSGGYFGHTYELEGNKICKVCYDRDEIKTVNLLIGKNNKYLINYYDTFRGLEFDLIIMEKVDLNINEKKLKKAEKLLDKATGGYINPDIGDILFETIPNIINYISHIPFNSYLLDIVRMYIECSKYGKLILDLEHNNFGIKNGHLVAFDFKILPKKVNDNHIKKLKETEEEIKRYRKNPPY